MCNKGSKATWKLERCVKLLFMESAQFHLLFFTVSALTAYMGMQAHPVPGGSRAEGVTAAWPWQTRRHLSDGQ